MDPIETPVAPLFTDTVDNEKSHSGLAVVIPVIIAGVVGLGALAVRKLRKKPDVTSPLTEAPTEIPTQD